jgi:hypothetical protein
MKTDIENLQKIYESFKRSNLDFLHLENVNNFNWNIFHEEYSLHQFYLFEKFEHLTDVKTSNGIESIYRLTSDLGSVYNLKLNWVDIQNNIWDATSSLMSAKKNNSADIEKYEEILNRSKNENEKYILYVYFEDSSGNTKITNNTQRNQAFVIFKGLENSIKHFLNTDDRLDKTSMVRFFVDKNEERRLDLYKNILNRIDELSKFHQMLVDKVNHSKYNIITVF